jgi:signal transduction histidine kinase
MGATRIGCLDAADLGLRADRARIRNIATTCRAALTAAPQLWALAALCLALIAFEQLHPLAFRAPTLRAVVETELTLCALAAAGLFAHGFRHRRRLRDLLLVGALVELAVIDLISYVVPAAIGLHSPGILTVTPVLGQLFVAAAIAAAALIPDRHVAPGRKPLAIAVGASILGATVAELAGLALRGQLAAGRGVSASGFLAALGHPLGVLLTAVTTALLIAAAVGIVRADRDSNALTTMLLGAAMIVFAAASLNYLVLPTHDIGWITAREGLRLTAYGLILVAALRQGATIRQVIAEAAATSERRRIARDLHDGLAQDLAFIAAHGDRIATEEGEDHPLAIAARRALAVSRGAIADLSASEAPSASAALHQMADELEPRLGLSIEIDAENAELQGDAREDVIRIVREAIVNAAHGEARNITVSLARRGDRFVLRIRDDGVGIGSGPAKSRPGFGLRSMRERAASLGGGLDAQPAFGGGTELEVTFP